MSTVAQLKDGSGYVPLLLCAFTFQDSGSTQFLCSTHPLDGVSGPAFPGIGILPAGNYVARIDSQDISSFQQRSQLGIDRISQVTIHLFDDDSYVYSNYVAPAGFGFRGATLQAALVMWKPGTATFSSDAPVMFVGTCDMEVSQKGCTRFAVSANNSHNMATVSLPNFPIENRCPKIFPPDAASRALAVNPNDPTYGPCGYSADQSGGYGNIATTGGPANDGKNVVDAYGNPVTDSNGVYVSCDFLRSNKNVNGNLSLPIANTGCMARLGNYASTGVAPDGDLSHDRSGRPTGAFAGVEWSPGTYYALAKNYVNQNSVAIFSFLNPAILGQYQNMVYGKQFVNGKIANVVEDGNSSKCEVMLCVGNIGTQGVSHVIVNGVEISENNYSDLSLTWRWLNNNPNPGSRLGRMNTDTGYSDNTHTALGDPYGSIAVLETVVYNNVFSGFSTPSVQVLLTGPQLNAYKMILTAVGSGGNITLTFATSVNTYDVTVGSSVTIYGCLWASLNGNTYSVTAMSVAGSTISLTISATGTGSYGAGGFIQYIGQQFVLPNSSAPPTDEVGNGINPNCNPAWVLMDVLQKCNWDLSELDVQSFVDLSNFSFAYIKYLNSGGALVTHPRYKLQFSIEQRQKAAVVVAGIVRAFNGYLAWSQSGLLQVFCGETLADSQPSPVTGSNYNTPVASTTAQFQGAYGASNTYAYGDVVTESGTYYRSIVQNNYDSTPANSGNDPATSPSSWSVISAPVGYVAYSFDETNILRAGASDDYYLDVTQDPSPTANTPNQIFINFQDEDNSFVQDSLSEIGTEAASRSAGALQPGGSLIPETVTAIGISNFDQGIRVANTYLAERQYGNIRGDAGGTTVFTIGTTVRCEHLRVGHLVFLSIAKYGLSKQLFRVIDKQSSTDFATARLKLQWHEDAWYEDIYGQSPQSFYSQPSLSKPGRVPLPWQPAVEVPNSNIWSTTDRNFSIFEVDEQNSDGSLNVILEAQGYIPSNNIGSAIQPPRVPVVANVSTTGGSITGGQTILIQITASDGTYESAPSQFISATIPSGTNTNSITINNLVWAPTSSSFTVYAGSSHFNVTYQLSSGSTPSSITLASIPNYRFYAPPDLTSGCIMVQSKNILHGGIVGSTVVSTGSSTVTIGGPAYGTFTADLTTHPHRLMLIGRPNAIAVSSTSISAATNAATAVFTSASTIPFSTGQTVQLSGFTGSWSSANGSFYATVIDSTHFSIALDSSGFGALTGSPLFGYYGWNSSNNHLPILDILITGYSISGGALVLSLASSPSGLFFSGDAVLVTASGSVNSSTSVGDLSASHSAGNTYYPIGQGAFTGSTQKPTVGAIVRIIGGTGRYQMRTISSVSSDGSYVTITHPWQTIPDDTSVFSIEDSQWFSSSSTTPFTIQNPNISLRTMSQDVGNVPSALVLFQVLIGDPSSTYFANENWSPFRLYYIFGNNGYYTIQPSGGVATLDPANGPTQIVTLPSDGSLLTITISAANLVPVAGFQLTLYVRTPASGTWQTPAFTGGANGFASDIVSGLRYTSTAPPNYNLQDQLIFTFHGPGSTATMGTPCIGSAII